MDERPPKELLAASPFVGRILLRRASSQPGMLTSTGVRGDSDDDDVEEEQTRPKKRVALVLERAVGFRESCYFDDSEVGTEDADDISLLYSKHERIPMKDFAAEVRAGKDVKDFVDRALVLLDVSESNFQEIMERILLEMHNAVKGVEPNFDIEQAKATVFTNDSVRLLARTIQGTCCNEHGWDYDQSWICVMGTLANLQKRHVAIARLQKPANLGHTSQEIHFIILVMAPTKEKGTKNFIETGRTLSTLFSDLNLRYQLLAVSSREEFIECLKKHAEEVSQNQGVRRGRRLTLAYINPFLLASEMELSNSNCLIGRGIQADVRRRLPHFLSDFKDGVMGNRTVEKLISTTFFLYFICLLPSMAFGVLNNDNTRGKIGMRRVIISQVIGGLFFSLIGGQPLIVLQTTAPLALFTKVIHNICEDFNLDFYAMYAMVGIWNSIFLLFYAMLDVSRLMRWSSRSVEEIFALFVSIAYIVNALRDVAVDFNRHYYSEKCILQDQYLENVTKTVTSYPKNVAVIDAITNITSNQQGSAMVPGPCLREYSLLHVLLMLGTLWVGYTLYRFRQMPFLNAKKREILSDYALPVSCLSMSFLGSYIFRDIQIQRLDYDTTLIFEIAPFHRLPVPAIFGAMGLGFSLSLLMFMDQNIASALVNNPANKLKKGSAFHWDLLVIALINIILSLLGLSWVHGALPHSPLHVRALADVEERVDQGNVQEIIVKVRETRLTTLFAHILIGLSLLMLPKPLVFIPPPVLNGLFLYIALTSLDGNQMFERIMLLVTEQAAYPPNHYIRRVPQRKIHIFTLCQMLQLVVLCAFGFSPWPYLKMVFPVMLMLLLPIRFKIIPKIIPEKYLSALD